MGDRQRTTLANQSPAIWRAASYGTEQLSRSIIYMQCVLIIFQTRIHAAYIKVVDD